MRPCYHSVYCARVGWIEAVVKIVTGLAWPIVAVVGIVVLRKQLAHLLERMTHFKGPAGLEADFGMQAAATNDLAVEAIPNPPKELTPPAGDGQGLTPSESMSLDGLLGEADVHPVGAIVRAWNLVEAVAAKGFPAYNSNRVQMPRTLVAQLYRDGLVSDEVYGLTERLNQLRNQVVHGQTVPTVDAAHDFVDSAWRLSAALDMASREFLTKFIKQSDSVTSST